MSTPITPVPHPPPATYPIPAPGEGVTSANTAQYVQPIADAIAWAGSRVPGLNPSTVLLDIILPPQCGICSTSVPGSTAINTDWIPFCGISSRAIWFHQNLGGGDAVRFPIGQSLIQGMVIHAFSVDFIGGGGHGALPGIRPIVKLIKTARATGGAIAAQTVIDSQADASANVAAYQVIHSIGKTMGTPESIDLSLWCYELVVIGEGGTNSLTGSSILDSRVSVSA